jgi:hypothetical protein
MTSNLKNIYPLLKSILKGEFSRHELDKLAYIALQIALVRVEQYIESGKINLNTFQMSARSIAVYCISDLFLPDRNGELKKINSFFSDEKDIELLDEDKARYFFRSLVFMKIQDGLARLWGEIDPIYNKILRNLRHHININPEIKKFKMLGEIYIYSAPDNSLNDRCPSMPMEELEFNLHSRLRGNDDHSDCLELMLEILNEQTEYQKFYLLSDMADVIRRIHTLKINHSIETNYNLSETPDSDDLEKIITNCMTLTRKKLYTKYVNSEKMGKELFDKFFHAIEEIIFDAFLYCNKDGNNQSYFSIVQKHIPEITNEQYRKEYHNIFEYLVKLSKDDIREQLKELFQ